MPSSSSLLFWSEMELYLYTFFVQKKRGFSMENDHFLQMLLVRLNSKLFFFFSVLWCKETTMMMCPISLSDKLTLREWEQERILFLARPPPELGLPLNLPPGTFACVCAKKMNVIIICTLKCTMIIIHKKNPRRIQNTKKRICLLFKHFNRKDSSFELAKKKNFSSKLIHFLDDFEYFFSWTKLKSSIGKQEDLEIDTNIL